MRGATRREVLVGLLGLPAASACRRGTSAQGWDGGWVHELAPAGHRLRDGAGAAPEGAPREVRALVVGGGVAGLVAARALVQGGITDLELHELATAPGGTARAERGPVTAYPWGAHYLPCPGAADEDLVAFLEEAGVVEGRDPGGAPRFEESQRIADPEERVFAGGLWFEGLFPMHLATAADREARGRFLARIDALVARRDAAGRRAFDLPVARSSDDPDLLALDGVDLATWLAREGLDTPLVRAMATHACRDDFGTEAADTSAWYGLHYFAARTEAPGQPSAPLLSWPEGNGRLVDALVRAVGAGRVRTGRMVTRVEPAPDGRRARVTSIDLASGRAEALVAERVVLAVPAFVRQRIVHGFPGLPEHAPGTSPWLVANLHLSGRPASRGFETAWDNVIHGSRSLGYVVATHQGGPSHGPTVWTYYLPLTDSDPARARRALLALSHRDASEAVVSELERAHVGLRPLVERVDLVRWGHAMVRPVPGTLTDPARRRASTPLGPLGFAHSDLSGVALFEEAFAQGLRAGREALGALGSGPG